MTRESSVPLPCLEKKQLPTMHFSPGRLKSGLSCTTSEAQGGVGVYGISLSPELALWWGLGKPCPGQGGAGKGSGPSNRAHTQFLHCVLGQLTLSPDPGMKEL